jgi:hypothetical protein
MSAAMKIMKTTQNKTNWGFAMPGTLLNLTAGGFLAAAVVSVALCNMQKVAGMASYPGLNSESQDASSLIEKDIRRASAVEQAVSNEVVLKYNISGHVSHVTYTYNAAARTLTRTDERVSQTVLTDLESFSFSFFQHPGANAAFNTFAAAQAGNARIVGCRWSCSRKAAGAKVDAETVELAPVVLRNHC